MRDEMTKPMTNPPDAVKKDDREDYWKRRLGRLHLHAEPLAVQLARYRRVTWALTIVPGIIALMFLALFTAFSAPGIGLLVASILFVPLVSIAWLDYRRLSRAVADYERERIKGPGR